MTRGNPTSNCLVQFVAITGSSSAWKCSELAVDVITVSAAAFLQRQNHFLELSQALFGKLLCIPVISTVFQKEQRKQILQNSIWMWFIKESSQCSYHFPNRTINSLLLKKQNSKCLFGELQLFTQDTHFLFPVPHALLAILYSPPKKNH